MSRRRCQYRENPRRCCIDLPGQPPDEADNFSLLSSVASSRSTRPSPSVVTSPSGKKIAKHIGSSGSSFLRIGNQQAVAATTFAAAVSPTSLHNKNKHLFNRTNVMSKTPLLGSGETSSHAAMNKQTREPRSSLGSSFFASGKSSSKKQDGGDPSTKKKKRSLSRSISKKMASVSSKVKRGGKSKSSSAQMERQSMASTAYSRHETTSMSDMSSDHLRSSPHLKSVEESSDGSDCLEVEPRNQAEDATGQFISLEPDQTSVEQERLSPLSFDDTKVVNHFRGSQGAFTPVASLPAKSKEDFSLNKALSPLKSADGLDGRESPPCPEFLRFLSDDACDVHNVSPLEIDAECCIEGSASLPRSNSDLSMPSLGRVASADGDIIVAQLPQVAVKDEAADTAIVWGALGMILGSPAPKSVKKLKKRTPINLWQSEGEDTDDMISLPEDYASSVQDASSEQVSQAFSQVSQEDENRQKFNQTLKRVMREKSSGSSSTRKQFNISDSSLGSSKRVNKKSRKSCKGSAKGKSMHRSVSSESISSMPSVCSRNDANFCNSAVLLPVQTPQNASTNAEEAADTTLIWGTLGMILGSPAPKMTVKKQKRTAPVNLWQDDDEGDDMISLSRDDVSVDCSIPSMMQEEAFDNDLLPEMIHVDEINDLDDALTPAAKKASSEEIADSTFAWTALTAILGSPAPSSVVRKRASSQCLNLWADGDDDDVLPEIFEEKEESCDVLSLPSIDQSESADADEGFDDLFNDFFDDEADEDEPESAESVLAWSALGMLLGSPAPKLMHGKKSRKTTQGIKNLWGESDNALDTIPSIEQEEDVENMVAELEELAPVETPLAASTDKKGAADSALAWTALTALLGSPAPSSVVGKTKRERRSVKNLWDDGNADDLDCLLSVLEDTSSEECHDQDIHRIPLLSVTYNGEDDDTRSIPSISGTSDDSEDPSSRTGSFGGSYEDVSSSPPRPGSSKNELTNSVLAWRAVATLLE